METLIPYNNFNNLNNQIDYLLTNEIKSKDDNRFYKIFDINQIIAHHNLGPKLKEEFLSEFVEFREYNFLSFEDNIFLLGFHIFLTFKFKIQKQNIENLFEFLLGFLTPLVNENGFPNKICDKLLGKTLNMLFIQSLRDLFEKMQNLDGFMVFLKDTMNFKERVLCEVLFKILCFEVLDKSILTKKKYKEEEIKIKKQKIMDFLLSDRKSFLDNEAKHIIDVICELSLTLVNLITIDSDQSMKIVENFPTFRNVNDSSPKNTLTKNIILFNDSIYGVYILEKINISSPVKLINQITCTYNEILNELDQINPAKIKKNSQIEQKIEEEVKPINEKSQENKIICVKCANGQLILDDYNKLNIHFLINCEVCHQSICSIHKDIPAFCSCFCKNCKDKMEKRYHFKNSADFAFCDDCYELNECKKCKIIKCLHCNKSLKSYEEVCDCQCQICYKKILNKFENQELFVGKCSDCSDFCLGCFLKRNRYSFVGCDVCGQKFCRTCVNEFIFKNELQEKKPKNGKISVVNNQTFICKFCNPGKK